ncbi:MAG: hypothetical protein ACLFOY_04605 [Desulfatibacillaceae bacterium]
MFTKLKQWFTPGDNPDFVRMIQVARGDPEFRKQLHRILELDRFNRESALNTMLAEMRVSGAPAKLVAAVAALLDHDVADRVLEMIRNGELH